VLAMVPLARSDFFGPQAITLLGGLLVATVLTIVFVPALYAACFGVRRADAHGSERATRTDGSSSLTARIRTSASALSRRLSWK
jgi:multidrug efflux pump